jgi:hypothetical protein
MSHNTLPTTLVVSGLGVTAVCYRVVVVDHLLCCCLRLFFAATHRCSSFHRLWTVWGCICATNLLRVSSFCLVPLLSSVFVLLLTHQVTQTTCGEFPHQSWCWFSRTHCSLCSSVVVWYVRLWNELELHILVFSNEMCPTVLFLIVLICTYRKIHRLLPRSGLRFLLSLR